jgi:hypothetical protein
MVLVEFVHQLYHRLSGKTFVKVNLWYGTLISVKGSKLFHPILVFNWEAPLIKSKLFQPRYDQGHIMSLVVDKLHITLII